MTIRHPAAFYRKRPAGFDGEFNWDFLLPAFSPTKITPMDIDGVIERFGNFLIFETKDEGKDLSMGQTITLKSLLRLGPPGRVIVVVIWAKTPELIQEWLVWWVDKSGEIRERTFVGGAEELVSFTRRWFQRINKNRSTAACASRPSCT